MEIGCEVYQITTANGSTLEINAAANPAPREIVGL